ncbi:15-hydroxyprostaglandin dehydrogenase [Caerostris extrusa]|uniref:15-hydroxyprostaglandin dehydrogenase [NAD(+)] n=1 Tax=Caerostris extrusa TaxID=172846 RepID=A0AAV4S2M0_CAEEX|nr:15-hydroxyprostaglandin dehydrogenase [Caerostris extrusa]
MDFNGKVALITGGAQGIGKAFSLALLNEGTKVCICDINDLAARKFVETLPDILQNNIIFEKCDVSSFSALEAVFEKVISIFGKIDIVVNNAGVLDEHNWRLVIDVNCIGVINGVKLAFHYMNKNSGGQGGFVVNTGSNTGFEPFELGPIYAACKHAINGLTRSYGTEYHWEKTGIKVNAICPGPVDTTLGHSFPDKSLDKEVAEKHNKAVKFIKPEDVADALIFLLKENKNGALLRIDHNGKRFA